LDGKRAFVPGGSRGIGLGCAVALAEAGARVVIAARSAEQVAQTAKDINDAGLRAEGVELDVTDRSAVREVCSEPFNILCNSAGLARHADTLDVTEPDFDAVTELNFKATFFLAQDVARTMPSGGSIIQISSQMGHVGGVERSVYAATKHAVEGMTKSMAIDLGPKGIRVNTICPTFIRTPLTEQTFSNPERVRWIEDKIKLGRIGEVEDIMGAVVFLASEASALVTGTSILVDGGWTAG